MVLSPRNVTSEGDNREGLQTQPLPSIPDLFGGFYPTRFQPLPTNDLFRKPSHSGPPVSYASEQSIRTSFFSSEILQFDDFKAGPCRSESSADDVVKYRPGESRLSIDLVPRRLSQPPVNYTHLFKGTISRDMASQTTLIPTDPSLSAESNISLCHMTMSLNVIENTSVRSLEFVRNHSAAKHCIPASMPSVFEIDDLLSMERQKDNALNQMRDEIIRLKAKQMIFQQDIHSVANGLKKVDDVISLRKPDQTEESRMTPCVLGKRQKRQKKLRCLRCDCVRTPEWRRGPDGPRTLCNACGLHYAKATRQNQQSKTTTILSNAQLNNKSSSVQVSGNASA